MISMATKPGIKEITLGFLGVGWIGCHRMEVMQKAGGVKIASIVEPSEENASRALAIAGGACVKDSPEALYNDPELDGIVIATPSALHAEQCLEALSNKKAVFCQKPLGRTAGEVEHILRAARKHNKLLAVDLSYRFTAAFQKIKEIIIQGEIGEIRQIALVFHNAYGPDKPWFYQYERSGGGCVIDLGIHLIDLALLATGFPEIKELTSHLYAGGKKLAPGEEKVEDFASVSMVLEGDIQVNLDCSWNLPAGREAIIEARFYGSKGGVALRNLEGSFYDFTAERYDSTRTSTLVDPPDQWGGRAGVAWARDLYNGKGYDPAAGEELLKTTRIIDRIYAR